MTTTLDSSDDAATKILGDKWRMPTKAEWDELFEKCKFSNGVLTVEGLDRYYYYTVTGPNGNSICFARIMSSDLGHQPYDFWSSTLNSENPEKAVGADIMCSSLSSGGTEDDERFYGRLIRAVEK